MPAVSMSVDGLPLPGEGGVERVARGACDVAHNRARLAQDGVQQRRFADIRATDDGDFDGFVGGFLVRFGRGLRLEVFEGALQHLGDVVPVNRRDGDWLTQPQREELGALALPKFRVVRLVDQQQGRLAPAPQQVGDLLVGGGQPVAGIHQKQDAVRLVHRHLRLHAHLLNQRVILAEQDAARVDDHERLSQPLALAVQAVARDAWGVLHDGYALPNQAVEQRGFADIGASDNRQHRFAAHSKTIVPCAQPLTKPHPIGYYLATLNK
jgi:hypothetical protein